MITLRCTKKAADALRVAPIVDCPAGSSPLGDWYVNLVPTIAGEFFVFTNERSLLCVVMPLTGTLTAVLRGFVGRVGNILSMLGVPNSRIEEEIEHFRDVRVGKTASRRVLGIMTDYAYRLQAELEDSTPRKKLSISDLELQMAEMPQATLPWYSAGAAVVDLLKDRTKFGAV